jgi:carbon storage regulator CsrA
MLVLGRNHGEAVWIGDVRVVVQVSRGGHVRLAIDAPPHVTVLREELVAGTGEPITLTEVRLAHAAHSASVGAAR